MDMKERLLRKLMEHPEILIELRRRLEEEEAVEWEEFDVEKQNPQGNERHSEQ
jgi:hypothetical protein